MSTFALNFEQVSGLTMTGSASVYEVTAPNTPATLIRRDQAWKVAFDWQTSGPGGSLLAGTWRLRIYLERMGGAEFGFVYPTGQASLAAVADVAPHNYAQEIAIGASVVPAGLFKLCAAITHENTGGDPTIVAGFAEGPLLHFYDTV